tara:strand:+ start:77766 stop:78932 length:1167 start_codon:yes stop_codon:yes gene_type:complete
MQPRWKTIVVAALKFSIPAAIIAFLLWRVEPEQWEALSQQPKNYGMLAAALVVALAAMCISFARWCVLVRCQGIEMTMVEAFRLGSIGFLLSFVSAGSVGGDLFKAIFLARRRPGKRIEAVASVLVDRGAGLYGLLLLVAVTLMVTDSKGIDSAAAKLNATTQVIETPSLDAAAPLDAASAADSPSPTDTAENPPAGIIDMQRITWATAILVGIGTIVLSVLVLGGKGVDRLIQWAGTFPLVGPLVLKIGGPLRMFHTHPVAFVFSIVMSLGVHTMLVFSFYLIARGLYANPPTLAEHFVIVPIALIASALPVTPAGVGILEAVVEALYRIVPAIKTNASGTLVALVFEMVKVVMSIIGTVFYWTAGTEVRESLEIAEEESHPAPATA